MPGGSRSPEPWRGVLRRHLTVLLLLKAAALVLLWLLFFSPAHRAAVDAPAVERRLEVGLIRSAREPALLPQAAAAEGAIRD